MAPAQVWMPRNMESVPADHVASSEPPVRRLRASHADRDRAVAVIDHAHQSGRLTAAEASERRSAAQQAVYLDELPALMEDLPDHEQWALLPTAFEPSPVPAAHYSASQANLPAVIEESTGFSLTVMSGSDVSVGPTTTEIKNFAWWGGNNYNLTHAMGPGRTVTLELSAVMAGHNVIVPPGVRVVDRSLAIMAGNSIEAAAQGDGSNGTLILTGFLWWAGHDVKLDH